jgi:hypothetical protein
MGDRSAGDFAARPCDHEPLAGASSRSLSYRRTLLRIITSFQENRVAESGCSPWSIRNHRPDRRRRRGLSREGFKVALAGR